MSLAIMLAVVGEWERLREGRRLVQFVLIVMNEQVKQLSPMQRGWKVGGCGA